MIKETYVILMSHSNIISMIMELRTGLQMTSEVESIILKKQNDYQVWQENEKPVVVHS